MAEFNVKTSIQISLALEHKTFSEVQRAQEILRILHLYTLPELVLKTRDVTLLQDALGMVEGQIATTSKNILSYISVTLVYEEVDDTLQVISIEAEWQMVSHYQLLYI